jgi:SAM domain (Sterile alpha motif)
MQQIADWLKALGPEQYAQRFAENDIDVSVLRHLTDADLEKIGVSLGHRRKMLAAIAERHGVTPSKPEAVGVVEPKPQDAAERRQVTVMCHFNLPEMRHRDCGALWRLRCEVHGRRRPHLLWISAGP